MILFTNVYVEARFNPNVLHLKVKIMKRTFLGTLTVLRYYKIDSQGFKC